MEIESLAEITNKRNFIVFYIHFRAKNLANWKNSTFNENPTKYQNVFMELLKIKKKSAENNWDSKLEK